MSEKTMRFAVSGRVQGVFFRASTRQQARLFGLRGWVRNLPDGRVEGIAQGTPQALAELHSWLQHGPPQARVLKVEWEEVETDESFSTFDVR